jgi:carboxyl-terminal processing protease
MRLATYHDQPRKTTSASRTRILGWGLAVLCLNWQGLKTALGRDGDPPASASKVEALDAAETAKREQGREGSFGGIGAELAKTNGILLVKRVMAFGPAEKAGLKAGSEVVSINGLPTRTMAIEDAVKLLRGPAGTTVELEVAPPNGTSQRLTLTRAQLLFRPVEGRLLEGGLVHIRVSGFDKATAGEVRKALTRLGGPEAKGVVLDFRNESGGVLEAVTEVASLLVGPNRTLWFLKDTTGRVSEAKSRSPAVTSLPLVVLVNGQTRCGELIAVAVRRNQRGTVVGQRTSGTSAAKQMVKNPDGTSRLAPAGSFLADRIQPITGVGVQPDKVLPDSASDDDFLKAAREALSAAPGAQADAAERLRRIKDLYDKGLIGKEDYERKRQEILNSL